MDSKGLEDLYLDEEFDDYLLVLARKNLLEFDDFKQDVFIELTNAENRSLPECKRLSVNLANRLKYNEVKKKTISLDAMMDSGLDIVDSFIREPRRYDNSCLSAKDQMVCDLVGEFQPRATRDIYQGRLILNGEV